MPKVSITLPSLRPNLFAQCADSIRSNAGYDDFEIVAVSPFRATGDKVRWIEERDKNGACRAQATAYEQCSGDIIVAMSDYIITRRNWLRNLVAFIDEHERRNFPFCAGLFWANTIGGPTIGTVFGNYYPYFPAATRRSFEAAGGYFSRDFIAHFGDPDLGMRFWAAGGKCQPCWDSVITQSFRRLQIEPARTGLKEHLDVDLATFLAKWHARLGPSWVVNRAGDFNLDLPVGLVDFEDLSVLPTIVSQVRQPDGRYLGYLNGSLLPVGLRYGGSCAEFELVHDPEKWIPVFR